MNTATADTGAVFLANTRSCEGDEEMNAAVIVRASVRHARRHGVSLDSLPPILRLCSCASVTAVILHV